MPYRLTPQAEAAFEAILAESARAHGYDAADRYRLLPLNAARAVGDVPHRPGSVAVPRVPGLRAFPARLVRDQVPPIQRVGSPRHVLIYRPGSDGVVDVLGFVHDAMLLPRAARRLVRGDREGGA